MTTATTDTDKEQASEPTQLKPRRRRLESLPSHARTTGDQAAARSRLVRRLRIALPVLALVLVAAFLFNTKSNEVDQAFLDDFKVSVSAEELRMAGLSFAGVDDKGKPFKITSDAVLQNVSIEDVYSLEQPKAVQGDTDETTVVTAQRGVYRSDVNILELEDDVRLQHEVGAGKYVFRSPSATVSIKDEVVTSDAGVGGQSDDGSTLQADHMKAYNAEGRVVFEGNVRMRIYPKNAKSDKANADKPDLKDPEIETP